MNRVAWLMVCFFAVTPLLAQQEYRVSPKDSKMIINGTSSLHGWQCRVEQFSGQLKGTMEGGKLKAIQSVIVAAQSISIRSIQENGQYFDKNMDKNVYKALQADQHPTITFTLSSPPVNKPAGSSMLESSGTLRIAGVTKEIKLVAKAAESPTGIVFEGKVPIKMSDYNVDPPTALFGTIRTGNEITIDFKMVFLPIK
jgi:polyisoprenoid-binding protein YceI